MMMMLVIAQEDTMRSNETILS